jgi:hypothetical protein
MKKTVLFLMLALALNQNASAQFKYDYGFRFGAANYLGDIGGKNLPRRDLIVDMHLPSTRWAAGVFVRKRKNKKLAFSSTFDYIRIQGTDQLSTYFPRRARNLTFKNDMFELSARAEYTLYYDSDLSNQGYFNPDMKIYVFGGVAGLFSNPKGLMNYYAAKDYNRETGENLEGEWIPLRKYRTEGQGKAYSAATFAVPMGIGMYFTYMKKWRVGWEYSWRMTFTDYLDDLSGTIADPAVIKQNNPEDFPLLESYIYHSYDENYIGKKVGYTFIPAETNPDGILPANFSTKDSPRGNPLNNDNYMTFQLYVSKVIRSKSNFYKSKYSWMRGRSGGGVRRAKIRF